MGFNPTCRALFTVNNFWSAGACSRFRKREQAPALQICMLLIQFAGRIQGAVFAPNPPSSSEFAAPDPPCRYLRTSSKLANALHSHSAKSPEYGDISRWLTPASRWLKPDLQRFSHKYRQERNTTLALSDEISSRNPPSLRSSPFFKGGTCSLCSL